MHYRRMERITWSRPPFFYNGLKFVESLRMKRYLLYCLLSLLPPVLFAGHSEQVCSGCKLHGLPIVPTHVKDSGLLRYDVHHYGISLEVNDTSTYITGYTDVSATALEKIEELVFELSSAHQVDSVFIGENRMDSYTHLSDLVRMDSAVTVAENEQFRVYGHSQR